MLNPKDSSRNAVRPHMSDGRERDKAAPDEAMSESGETAAVEANWTGRAGTVEGRKRYADVAATGHVRDRKNFVREELIYSDKEMRDVLSQVCHESSARYATGTSVECTLPGAIVFDSFAAASRRGVCFFFMGKPLKPWLLTDWADLVIGPDIVEHFIFLGKGLYFAQCVSEEHAHNLLQRGTIAGNGTYACVMPWNALFDPMQDVLRYCPVWVSIPNFPIYLRHQIHGIVSCLGKVLFVPRMDAVISTTVRVCILWDMSRPIPSHIEWGIGMKDPLCFLMSFSSFPNACYRCKFIGHFAKSCPVKSDSHEVPKSSIVEVDVHAKDGGKALIAAQPVEAMNLQTPEHKDNNTEAEMEEEEEHSSSSDETDEDESMDESEPAIDSENDGEASVTGPQESQVEAKNNNEVVSSMLDVSRSIGGTSSSPKGISEREGYKEQVVKEMSNQQTSPNLPRVDPQKFHLDIRKFYDAKLRKFKIPATIRETRQGRRVILKSGENLPLYAFLDKFNLNGDDVLFVNPD